MKKLKDILFIILISFPLVIFLPIFVLALIPITVMSTITRLIYGPIERGHDWPSYSGK